MMTDVPKRSLPKMMRSRVVSTKEGGWGKTIFSGGKCIVLCMAEHKACHPPYQQEMACVSGCLF